MVCVSYAVDIMCELRLLINRRVHIVRTFETRQPAMSWSMIST